MSEVKFNEFVAAQDQVYDAVRSELTEGRKRTHWMWYVFPQLAGLGSSAMAKKYSIASLDEARAYLGHPVLGSRLREWTGLVLAVRESAIEEIFGHPDYLKFRSCMTLFSLAAPDEQLFVAALDKYFGGTRDPATIGLVK
jgi:uncharacterized protein (DUF1810 family)